MLHRMKVFSLWLRASTDIGEQGMGMAGIGDGPFSAKWLDCAISAERRFVKQDEMQSVVLRSGEAESTWRTCDVKLGMQWVVGTGVDHGG